MAQNLQLGGWARVDITLGLKIEPFSQLSVKYLVLQVWGTKWCAL